MASLLSNPVNNLSERIHKTKCKFGYDNKKCRTCGITYKNCDCSLEHTNFRDNLIEYKCLCCNKNYQQFDENLKGWFLNTCNNNRFVLLLQKGVCLYEYRMVGKNCNETPLPEKEDFYSHLIMEDISDAD